MRLGTAQSYLKLVLQKKRNTKVNSPESSAPAHFPGE